MTKDRKGMDQSRLIVADPAIKMGKPVIAGTRITVELILDKLAAGETVEQILDDYPQLSREAIQAVFKFAADTLRNEAVWYSPPDPGDNSPRLIRLIR